MFLSFRLFVLTIATPVAVVFSQGIDNTNINTLVGNWCAGNNATIIQDHGEIQDWDVTGVTEMSLLFSSSCNPNITAWDVSNVESMNSMFLSAAAFNQPIGDWDVGKVTNMFNMFNSASAFNQPIGEWDVGNVTEMGDMFKKTNAFNQPIGDWNVGKVMGMRSMFESALAFNQPIGDWDVGKVRDMATMFTEATAFNQLIGDWDMSKVINIQFMFFDVTAFKKLICWDSPPSPSDLEDIDLPCDYNTWNACCDSVGNKEAFDVSCGDDLCLEKNTCIPLNTTRSLVAEAVSNERTTGNLRTRALNVWFECGGTHCPKERSTCETNAVTNERYCKCIEGYEEGIECRPTDECETRFPCPGGSKCVDMFPPIRFKCECGSGYTPVLPNAASFDEPGVPIEYRPIQCLDKLECDEEVPPCHVNATCTNTIGGFECECATGLVGNGVTSCKVPDPVGVITVTDGPPPSSGCVTNEDCTGANMQCVDSECICIPGYAQVGPNCQNEVHCDAKSFNNDCHRRAICTEESGYPGFSCKCIDGWMDAFDGANGKACMIIPPPETEAPPEPVTEAALPEGVGPHPNRPTVFTCKADDAVCSSSGACCSGSCFLG